MVDATDLKSVGVIRASSSLVLGTTADICDASDTLITVSGYEESKDYNRRNQGYQSR